MEMMEIVLLIAGGIIFILSFFIPDKKNVSGKMDGSAESVKAIAEGELKGLISQEMDSIRTHVDDVVEEAVTYAMEKTERSLERLSNEKIMAVSEYSDTVLAEIHKNHEEAMFLYDMLNNKHINLKNTVSEVNRTVKEAEATVMNFQKLAPEPLSASEERIMSRAAEPAAQLEPGRFTQESSGIEKAGIGRSGMERAGIERSGIERAGIGRSGIERSGLERSGIDRAGMQRSGMEGLGTGRPATEKSGLERLGTGRSGSGQTAAGGAGIQNPGQGQTAAGRSGPDYFGQGGSGAANSGIGNPGLQNIRTEKNIIQQTRTEKSGLERLGAPSESVSLEKVSFMQDVEEQGRNNNERILELYQQGRSAVAIAKELGLGVGEVKLVIDLFKNQ